MHISTYLCRFSNCLSFFFYLSVYLSIYLSTYLPIYLLIYISIYLSIQSFIYLSAQDVERTGVAGGVASGAQPAHGADRHAVQQPHRTQGHQHQTLLPELYLALSP